MTKAQFDGLKRGDILTAASGKTYVVQVAEANALEADGRYIYVGRCNAQGGKDGLSARELACGNPIRSVKAAAKWTLVEGGTR